MNYAILKKDFILFIVFWIILSLGYYLIFRKEIQTSGNYSFILYSFFGASAIICVPLLKSIFKKRG
jgi:hypothetical protein